LPTKARSVFVYIERSRKLVERWVFFKATFAEKAQCFPWIECLFDGYLCVLSAKILSQQNDPPINFSSHLIFSGHSQDLNVKDIALSHHYKGNTHLPLATGLPLNTTHLSQLSHLKPRSLKEVMICCIMIDDERPIKSPCSLEIGTRSMKHFIYVPFVSSRGHQ
jgi:hypothetical protein